MFHLVVRSSCWLLVRLFWRVRCEGVKHLPQQGPAIWVCNHVTDLDVPLLCSISSCEMVLLVYYKHFEHWLMGPWLRWVGAIPMATQRQDRAHYDRAWGLVQSALKQGKCLLLFPEGRLTRDGTVQPFKVGLLKVLAQAAEQGLRPTVVPMAIQGLWGSSWSWAEPGGPLSKLCRRGWLNRVTVRIGAPLPPEEVDLAVLRERVLALLSAD